MKEEVRSVFAVFTVFVMLLGVFVGLPLVVGCATIMGTEDKTTDTNGYGAIADAKGMVGFISGDYLSVPKDVNYLRYCRVETSGFFNSASKNVRETIIMATVSTNNVFGNVPMIIHEFRVESSTNELNSIK